MPDTAIAKLLSQLAELGVPEPVLDPVREWDERRDRQVKGERPPLEDGEVYVRVLSHPYISYDEKALGSRIGVAYLDFQDPKANVRNKDEGWSVWVDKTELEVLTAP